MTTLADLRIALAEARIAVRDAKHYHELAKAITEMAAIEAGKGGGANAEARARALTIELADDSYYQNARIALSDAEAKVDRLNAEIAVAEDDIRLNEARIREKLADALMGRRADEAIDWYAVAHEAEQRRLEAMENEHHDERRMDF